MLSPSFTCEPAWWSQLAPPLTDDWVPTETLPSWMKVAPTWPKLSSVAKVRPAGSVSGPWLTTLPPNVPFPLPPRTRWLSAVTPPPYAPPLLRNVPAVTCPLALPPLNVYEPVTVNDPTASTVPPAWSSDALRNTVPLRNESTPCACTSVAPKNPPPPNTSYVPRCALPT